MLIYSQSDHRSDHSTATNHQIWTKGPKIGQGSSSTVHMAYVRSPDGSDRRSIAVKSALSQNSDSLEKERRVLAEFQKCPEIVSLYSAETSTAKDGTHYYNLLLEFASAGTLRDLINSRAIPESHVRAHTRTILRALNCIHGKGYVHCDVKPENILAFHNSHSDNFTGYTLKLADFGLSKEPSESLRREDLKERFYGTPEMMSPESFEEGEIGSPLDVWSLGCTVVEMLTGSDAWNGCLWFDDKSLMKLISRRAPPIPDFISEQGKDFLSKCFIRDPNQRWSSQMLLQHPYVIFTL